MIPLAFFFMLIGVATFIVEFLLMYIFYKYRITDKDKRGTLESQTETYLCLALGIVSIIRYFL